MAKGKIDTSKFTDRMIMETNHSLDYYRFIQNNAASRSSDFESVYVNYCALNANSQTSQKGQ